jgi:glycerol-3-phosphate acyltransferase PlsY
VLYGVLPITKTVASALGAVIALLTVVAVAMAIGWRLTVTRSRKNYKKWNEEVCARALLCNMMTPLKQNMPCAAGAAQLESPQLSTCLVWALWRKRWLALSVGLPTAFCMQRSLHALNSGRV